MKRVLIALLSVLMVMTLAGCQSVSEIIIRNNQLDFDDITWEAYYGVEDNNRYMLMDIENNSKYIITDITFTYTEKEGVTDEERTSYLKELADLTQTTVEELHSVNYDKIEFSADYGHDINPGESVTAHFYYFHGSYYLMDEDHFNLGTPDYAEIEYVGDDEQIHETYYDFRTKKQRYSNESEYMG